MRTGRGLTIAVALVAMVMATGGAGAEAGSSGPAYQAWIDDPLDGALLSAGPVTVDVHGTDDVELQLVDNGTQIGVATHPSMDGRLSRAAIPWNATPGGHSLTVRSGSAVSAIHDVTVLVPATPPPTPEPPTPPTSSSAGPTTPHGSAPSDSASSASTAPTSAHSTTAASRTSGSASKSTGASSSSGSSSSGPSSSAQPSTPPPPPAGPAIDQVTIDNRSLPSGDGCNVIATVHVFVTDATGVSVLFSPGDSGGSPIAMTPLADGSWAATTTGPGLGKYSAITFDVTVTATGPGGHTTVPAGQVSTVDVSCIH